jgi:hypothetical protein
VTGRKRNTLVRDDERADILTLARAGYAIARIADLLSRDERTVARVVTEDRDTLRKAKETELLDLHMIAARVAAENGDHRPVMDMMDRLGIVPETSRQRTQLQVARMASEAQVAVTKHLQQPVSSPTIQIGIAMPSQLGMSAGPQDVGRTPETLELPVISGAYVRPAARSDE